MSTDAKFSDVLAVVADKAPGWPRPVQVEYAFTRAVADGLALDFDHAPTSEWERFSRQVYRALTMLARDGALVKGALPDRGNVVVWRTPAMNAAYEAEQAEQAAERQGRKDRAAAQRLRLAAFGIVAEVQGGAVRLTPDQLDALMDLAAKGLG